MNEQEIEREQIAQVFVICPSDLEDEKWKGFTYWYEGVPEWSSHDFRPHMYNATDMYEKKCLHCTSGLIGEDTDLEIECHHCEGSGFTYHEIRTVMACELYGPVETPAGWTRLVSYPTSGEAPCGFCGPDTEFDGSDAQTLAIKHNPRGTCTCYQGDPNCPLCEGDGYIYIGGGWQEIIFVKNEASD